ncbi:hypothetical protein LVJ94_42485 [Pendulispora rubella]|uniref:Dickkopf N-terminal cysteine-rich domain-containing protein n=1 Tax=Pendulispora rubella TaxID=2741070 RepID=A0ABZ2KY99_9BACT
MFSPSLRERPFAWRAVAVGIVVAAIAAGCAASSVSGDAGDRNLDPGSFGPPPYALPDAADGGDGAASGQRGNLLCNADTTECYPDGTRADTCNEDPRPTDSTEDAGVPPPPPPATKSCHVLATGTTCLTAGAGKANATCTKATDCAQGFECVVSGTQGRCRHYCCDGRTSCDMKAEFCDIQLTKDGKEPSVPVPVCMPVRQCELLGSPKCLPDEDCSIVDENEGTTSCVAVGPALAGEDCSRTHCGRGLACLGQSGQRKCYQLCKKSDPHACAPTEKCVGSAPLFQDSNIGTCSDR